MTVTEEATVAHSRSPFREYVGATIGGTLLAVLALASVPGYPWIALAGFTAAGAAIAVVDVRTRRLPNRHTGPYALAGALQAAAVSIATADLWILVVAVATAATVFLAYALMGMAGWFGFGDAKFAGAVALFASVFAGWFAIYLVPLAVLLSAGERLARIAAGRGRTAHAHGPAIAAAALIVTAVGILT
ncbi:prepilin peptidase [Microbacterium sp. NFH-22A-Y]|uniref:prepilin peptidase n=1 Tax=Microbacterium sp. NFH-22A-Y TaxID=2744448 RepID=UPI001F27D5D3|nr:prepilin peptidase [Microbacterium sp. NFH-22A-Y]